MKAMDLFAVCKNLKTIVDVRADQLFAENVERSDNLLFKTRRFGKTIYAKRTASLRVFLAVTDYERV